MSLDFVAAVSLLRLGLSVSIIVADLCDTFFGDLDILAGEELARLEKGSSTYRNSEAVVSLSENQLDLRSRLLSLFLHAPSHRLGGGHGAEVAVQGEYRSLVTLVDEFVENITGVF